MTIYRDLSIKTKLSLIALLTCVTAMALACAALFVYEVHSFKRTLIGDLKAQATILAGLSTAALVFDDVSSASEMLGELKNQRHIKWAVIFKDGKGFVRYQNPDAGGRLPDGPPRGFGGAFSPDGLRYHAGIHLKGEEVGSIYLCADTSQLTSRLTEYAVILLAVFVASSLVALVMASRLRRSIAIPVQRLADTARIIAEQQDYSVRVTQWGKDEVGQLTGAFNKMLSRIQAQDSELREGRERFEVAVAGARDGIWDWNLTTDETYFSVQCKAILGYQDAELQSSRTAWMNLLHPEDRDAINRALREYLDGKRATYEVEFRMRHKDGGYRWILARGAALRDAGGKPYRMAGSHTDITERKQAFEQISRMQQELVDTSRQAGMAEVATGVLHNVGNVLNSVNVSASVVQDQLKKSKLARLNDAARLLKEHEADLSEFLSTDPKGKLLPGFLIKLAAHLAAEQEGEIKELGVLAANIEHIKEIVAMQQNYAKVSGVSEILSPLKVVEDVLQMNHETFSRHRITLEREFEEVSAIPMDKHKVMQIVVNLMRNAKQALAASGRDDKKIIVRVRASQAKHVQIVVEDNGVGIPPENLTKIFGHGFTTKKDGHGFGLHSAALAAMEMGGSLGVASDGPGCGARFTLELPMNPARAAQVAA